MIIFAPNFEGIIFFLIIIYLNFYNYAKTTKFSNFCVRILFVVMR